MYKTLYNFQVLQALQEGKIVNVCDKHAVSSYCINEMTVDKVVMLLRVARAEEERFIFWTNSENTENEEQEEENGD